MKFADSPQLESYKEGTLLEETPPSPRKKPARSLIIFLLLAIVIVSILPYVPFDVFSGTKTGTLTGQIVSLNGDAMNDVLVYIDQEWVSTYTDAKGIFTIYKVETGEQYLVVEAVPDIPEFFLVNIEHGNINNAGIIKVNAH